LHHEPTAKAAYTNARNGGGKKKKEAAEGGKIVERTECVHSVPTGGTTKDQSIYLKLSTLSHFHFFSLYLLRFALSMVGHGHL
jgi:hypothetical protein